MSSRARRWFVAGVLLIVVAILGGWAWSGQGTRHHQLALAVWTTAGVLCLVLALLEFAASPRASGKNYGYLDAIVGMDGRISTSKTVVFLWTIELAGALTLLGAVVAWTRSAATADQIFGPGDSWDGYFLLLGGPFAAAVAAKGITATTTANDPNMKPSTADVSAMTAVPASIGGTAKAADIVKNDDGTVSIADSQYWIFSLVAVLYFLGAFVGNVITYGKAGRADKTATIGLPPIPAALLGLTSAAALAYVGNKAVSTQGTRFSSLAPQSVASGGVVTANVVNLPATATRQNVQITLTKDGAQPITLAPTQDLIPSTGAVVFEADAGAGDYRAVIHTTGYSTPALPLKIT